MKIRLSDMGLALGLAMIFVPIYLEWSLSSWLYYLFALIGLVLCAISGMGARASMIGLGDTGEELLQRLWKRLKNKLQGNPAQPEDPLGWRKAKQSYKQEPSEQAEPAQPQADQTPKRDES